MPKTGCFFDAVIRQKPLDEDHMDPADNLEEFGLLGKDDLAHFRKKAQWLDERKDFGAILIAPGTAFGDIALVPAPFLKDPKGIRDLQEWYMATVEHRDYVYEVFEKQSDIALQNIQTLIELFGDRVQAVYLTGTDFGTQRSLFISLDIYRDLYKPFHKKLNEYVHSHSNWKTFIHSCGAISELIPDLIEAGFDILNPVQCSATGMDPVKLKKEFGKDLVFWGGGVNTQHTMPTGSPDEVYREVLNRIEIFNQGGGYVFDSIHNIQAQTPLDNMSAMFKAIRKSSKN
jgi:uroporphyrinogen-III decarboxylase